VHRVLIGKLEGRNLLGDLGIDGGIKKDVEKYDGKAWGGIVWYKTQTSGGL